MPDKRASGRPLPTRTRAHPRGRAASHQAIEFAARPAGRAPIRATPKIGLALAGGGPLGGIYEVGALLALADSLDGLDFNDLDVYVGVSSGGFVAAALANGISPARSSAVRSNGRC